MFAQSCAVTRQPRPATGLNPLFRRGGRALDASLYRDGVFALKLAASAFAGATVTLAIMNNAEDRQAVATFQDRYQASAFSQMHARQVWPDRTEPAEEDAPEPSLPSNYSRVVKTLRYVDPHPSSRLSAVAAVPLSLKPDAKSLEVMQRSDGSLRLRIPLRGSLQNPAWSPDGRSIAFTRFRKGYNKGPADVYVINLETNALQAVATDGSNNISQPGSSWNRNGQIVFSSDRGGHDEIWVAGDDGSRPRKLTSRSTQAYEPSFAPDGRSLVFESHEISDRGNSRITLFEMSENRYVDLTPPDQDCRQPNWSPRGDYILYQRLAKGRWDIWLIDVKTKQHRLATSAGEGNKTDATFSPDGRFVLYSGEVPGQSGASLLAMPVEGGRPVPITRHRGYHGAPSWSPDGAYVAMEASARDPDDSAGTELIITPVRKELVRLSFGNR